ncbi:hypothetical protein SpCBS45565_g01908 [Spizellomyces sp. 'palustris']|nr:hypothetical protein SpCBS45565_g01908 [Spizellomyces sp. 'palustris']
MATYKERVSLFERLLGLEAPADYDFERFRQLCYQGIPDHAGIRPKCWKILLNYLPFDERSRWSDILRSQRTLYYTFVKELIKNPSLEELENAKKGRIDDHPLSDALDSKWQTYFEELKVLEQIDKDVRRTLPDFAFFQLPVPKSRYSPLHRSAESIAPDSEVQKLSTDADLKPFSPIQSRRALFKRLEHLYADDQFGARSHAHQIPTKPSISPGSSNSQIEKDGDNSTDPPFEIPEKAQGEEGDLHWEAIERILFIYAKLNPGIGYVQGMNEILGPLYYVMANDTDDESRAHAEADSFFTFTILMSEFRDHFIRSLDNVQPGPRGMSTRSISMTSIGSDKSPGGGMVRKASMGELAMEQTSGNGIGNSMARLMKRLKRRDIELWKDFQVKGIHAAFFSFRWLTCLLTQEFALPDVIQLWDSILADLATDIAAPSSPGSAQPDDSQSRTPEGYLREGRFDFLIDVCCAMLICIRDELLQGSFADNLRMLQNYPISDVDIVLQKAYAFRQEQKEAAQPRGQKYAPGTHFTRILHRTDAFKREQEKGIASAAGPGAKSPKVLWMNLMTKPEPMRNPFAQKNANIPSRTPIVGSPPSTVKPNIKPSPNQYATTTMKKAPQAPSQIHKSASPPSTRSSSVQPTTSIGAVGGSLKEGFSGFFNRVRKGSILTSEATDGNLTAPQPETTPSASLVKGLGFMRDRIAASTAAVGNAVTKLGQTVKTPPTVNPTAEDKKHLEAAQEVVWIRPPSEEDLRVDDEYGVVGTVEDAVKKVRGEEMVSG